MKLSHVIIGASDLESSLHFYRDLLGLPVLGQVEGEFVFFDAGGSTKLALKILSEIADPGDTEFVFEVEDIHKTYEELTKKGISFKRAPRAVTSDATRDFFATDFRDPDGHVLSITGWVQKAGPQKGA